MSALSLVILKRKIDLSNYEIYQGLPLSEQFSKLNLRLEKKRKGSLPHEKGCKTRVKMKSDYNLKGKSFSSKY